MRRLLALPLVAALLCGCASTGDAGGGANNLPVSGAGPFRPLQPDPDIAIDAPFVLRDNLADLDEPSVLADGEALAIWVTARRGPVGAVETRIEHADAPRLNDGFGDLELAIAADQGWEAGGVSGPAVLRDTPWILFYSGGGAIGWATAPDGHAWQKAPGPALTADGLAEGNVLGAPAVTHVGDKIRVYYGAGGVIWAAEAPFADVAERRVTSWTRLDGDPTTPARDPMVSQAPFGVWLDRPSARATRTPAGRVRHDLYFTAYTGTETVSTCGFASSFDGDRFVVGSKPILPPLTIVRAPTETPYGPLAVLMYVQRLGSRDSIAAAQSP